MKPIIVFCAVYVYLLVVIGWVVTLQRLPKKSRIEFIATTVLAGAVAGLLALWASHLHYEPRPFVEQHVQPLVKHGTDNGFPSDHALLTMALTASAWFFNRQIARWMLLATVLVGLGRVAALLHSPQQILAGWLIGALAAGGAHYATHTIIKTFPRQDRE